PHGVDLHLMARVAAWLFLDENVVAVPDEYESLFRHLQVRARRLLELRSDEHLAFQLALAIFDRAAHFHSPACGIDEVGNILERSGESLIGPRRRAQLHFLAGPEACKLPLGRVELHP